MSITITHGDRRSLEYATAQLPASLLMRTPEQVKLDERLSDLSDQQMKVVLLLSHGHSNKTIAYVLKRSQATIKAHVSAIMRVLGCTNRTQAALLIFQWRSGAFTTEQR